MALALLWSSRGAISFDEARSVPELPNQPFTDFLIVSERLAFYTRKGVRRHLTHPSLISSGTSAGQR